MKDIFSIRLKKARKMSGLSMDALVEIMGRIISKNSISKYEKGEMLPSSTVLINLAKVLKVSPDYFFRPFSIEVGDFDFRKQSSLRIKDINRIKEKVSDYIERYIELEQIVSESSDFNNPVGNIKIHSIEGVDSASIALRNKWNIGNSPIQSVVELLEYNNVKIIEIDAPEGFDGLSAYVNNKYPIIVLKKDIITERKRFTALHELGHLVLDIDKSLDKNQIEKYCHRFASSVLITQDVINGIIGNKRTRLSLNELKELQEKYGISIDAIMYRLKELNVISRGNLNEYYKKKRRDSDFKEYVEKSRFNTNEISNRFNTLLAKSLSEELLTYSRASSLSMCSIEELKNTIRIA